MSGRGRPSFQKRMREQQRQQRRREKAARRADRRNAPPPRVDPTGGDPDLAGIVPGPQAQPWMDELPDESGIEIDDDAEDDDD